MSTTYAWVQWNRAKKVYDLLLAAACVLYLVSFIALGIVLFPAPNDIAIPILLMRALGTLAIVLLHLILLIGPLHRLNPRFAPLLYNRRHLGVTFFLIALLHALVATGFYGGFGVDNPLTAIVAGYDSYASIRAFPFELLGLIALVIFFVMAATSHDFFLASLSPRVWKWIHMLVYPAYALVVAHIALGAMQSEPSLLYPLLLIVGAIALASAHIAAAMKGPRHSLNTAPDGEWITVTTLDRLSADIPDTRAAAVTLPCGKRAAVFRNGDTISAMSNACAHQNGPLSEGQIIDGCVTCPWHGYQYEPDTAHSPPPFTEKLPTYELRLNGDAIQLNPTPRPTSSPATPLTLKKT